MTGPGAAAAAVGLVLALVVVAWSAAAVVLLGCVMGVVQLVRSAVHR